MPRIYNPFLIVTNQSGSQGPSQGLQFVFLSSSYGDLTTSGSLGGITARDIQANASGAIGEIVITAPSNVTSSGKDVARFFFTGSNGEEPRVGIGFEQNEPILKAFEVKTKSDSPEGSEFLIRSARLTKGGEVGDLGGAIRFSIESASYGDITSSGSVALIDSIVTSISDIGVTGDLALEVATSQRTAPEEMLRLRGDSNAATLTGSFYTTKGTKLGTSTFNTHILTGSVNIHGNLDTSGNITTNDITASSLTLEDSFQYNNVILESTESAISAGNTTLGEFPTASYKSVHVDYLISSGSSKARAGHLMSTWKGVDVTFTDTSAKSIGDTSDAEFSVVLNGANADLKITSLNSYDVSISSRAILNGSSFALGGGNISTSPFPFSGAATITGSLDITGSIIPGGDGVYDLGDSTHFWRTASIEHIVTLGDTIEFRDKDNKNTTRGTLKLDTQGGLKVRGSNNALTIVSASHGHFTGDMRVAGDLAISGISNVSASIAEAAASGGGGSGAGFPFEGDAIITGSLLVSGSTVDFSQASGVIIPSSLAYARMSMGTDVLNGGANAQNFTSATLVKTKFNTQDNLTSGLTVDTTNNRITVSDGAHYRLTANISFYSTSARITPTTFFRINGTTTLVGESYGYIRAASGQNENSNNVSRVIELSANDYVEVFHFDASSAGGAVYATQGIFEVEKLSGSGPKGDTGDTGAQGIQGPSGTSYDVVEVTGDTTLSSAHTTKYIVCNSATAIDITVPASATYDQYAEFVFEQRGAGTVRIVAANGVTINSSETLFSAGQYTVMGLKRTASNTYTLTGEREATP